MRHFFLLPVIGALLFTLGGCSIAGRPKIPEMESRIREICEIPGYEYIYRDIIYIDEKSSFLTIPLMDKRVLFAVDVRIQAGIDLKEGFSVEPVSRKSIRVSLPQPKVLLADADEESISQYFLKEYGGRLTRLEYYDEIERKKGDLIEDAVDRGILLRAEANVRKVIENFLKLSGYDIIEFERMRSPGAADG